MATTITYQGTTLWDSATNGAGWNLRPGVIVREVIDKAPSLGIGYWVKPANKARATHVLEIAWHTTTPGALIALVDGLANGSLGSLVVPGWGTFLRCRLADVGELRSFKSDSVTGYVVETSLTFEQYP